MTGMSDKAWQKVKEVGAQVSIAFPIEMNMRHGIPPILKMQQLGMEPSLSVDVECTMTADFFTQMRGCMTMQRMVVNQMVLEQGDFSPPEEWPKPAPGTPPLLTTRDVLRYGTMNGAKPPGLSGGRLIQAAQHSRGYWPRNSPGGRLPRTDDASFRLIWASLGGRQPAASHALSGVMRLARQLRAALGGSPAAPGQQQPLRVSNGHGTSGNGSTVELTTPEPDRPVRPKWLKTPDAIAEAAARKAAGKAEKK